MTILQDIYVPNVKSLAERKFELGKSALIRIARNIEKGAAICPSYDHIPMGDYPETMMAIARLYREAADEAVKP